MIRVAQFLLRALALEPRGQRAMDATMADWRHELERAGNGRRRLFVNVRSSFGVVRTLAQVGVVELPAATTGSFVWRFAALASAWIVWRFSNGGAFDAERFFLVTSDIKAWTLVAASVVPQGVFVLPLLVFLAESVGRRQRVTPIAGTLFLLLLYVAVLGLVVFPASATYLRYETWRYFANASVPEPRSNALLLSSISLVATVFATLATGAALVLANRIRRVGGVTGWTIGLGTILAVVAAGAVLQFPMGLLPVGLRMAAIIGAPMLTLTAIVLATTRLAGIEASRLQSRTGSTASTGAVS